MYIWHWSILNAKVKVIRISIVVVTELLKPSMVVVASSNENSEVAPSELSPIWLSGPLSGLAAGFLKRHRRRRRILQSNWKQGTLSFQRSCWRVHRRGWRLRKICLDTNISFACYLEGEKLKISFYMAAILKIQYVAISILKNGKIFLNSTSSTFVKCTVFQI